MIPLTELIGYIGATLTTTSFLPQAVKVIKTRDTQSISLWMYILYTTGIFFWFLFGLRIESGPVIVSNFITFLLSLTILVMKLREKKI